MSRSTRGKTTASLTALFLTATALVAGPSAATHDGSASVVNATSGASYGTVQAAINAAFAGDMLLLRAATYDEAVRIDKALTLCSAAPREMHCAGDPVGVAWTLQGAAWAADPTDVTTQALRIQTVADQGFGVASLALPAGTRIQDITALEFDAFYESGGCGGGSPRYTFSVDVDEDGDSDKTLNVYGGPFPSYAGCTLGSWLHHDLMDGALRWDAQSMGGPFYGTQAQAAAAAGPAHRLLSVRLIWDSPWAFPDQTEVSYFDNLRVNDVLLMEPSNMGCGGQPSTDVACPDGMLESVLDGAGHIYPVFITAAGVVVRDLTVQNPTFLTTDQSAGGRIDPSLVVVYGVDDVVLDDLVLRQPASPLVATQSRWITDGINVAEDGAGEVSDRVVITNNVFRDFVEGAGPDGTCANAPCRMSAIDLWGAGASPTVVGNDMLLPNGRPDSTTPAVVGIWGNAVGASVRDNVIRASAIGGLYGVKGTYETSSFEGNAFSNALHGVFVAGSGLTIADNAFSNNNEGLRITARGSTITQNEFTLNNIGVRIAGPNGPPEATGLVFRLNAFDDNTRTVSVHEQVDGVYVDLRENDWGVYARGEIELFLEDAGTGNVLDIRCFIDADGVTRVCPTAGFTRTIQNAAWPRVLEFTDASVSGGREIESRQWSMPDGTTPTTPVVTRSFSPGTFTVGLAVTDSEGFTDAASETFTLANTAPTIAAPASWSAVEGAANALTLVTSDAETDTLQLSMSGAPAGATLSSAGVFSWTPTYAQDGETYSVTFTVTDGAGSASATTAVGAQDVPVAPILTAPTSRALFEAQTLTVAVSAVDPDGGVATLAASGPSGAAFTDHGDGTGVFSWTAPAGSAGTHTATFTATAANGMTDVGTLTITVTQPGALALARVTPFGVVASPGQTRIVEATLTNTGLGADTFTLVASSANAPWFVGQPPAATLAAGASATVQVPVTVPATGGVSTLTLRACSTAQPGVCQTLTWRVSTPLTLSLAMDGTFGPMAPIVGVARATWANGAAASNVTVALRQQAELNGQLLTSSAAGTTGADGTFAYDLTALAAQTPGRHLVFGTATRGASPSGSAQTAYEVELA